LKNVVIKPSKLTGSIKAVSSKSICHRAVISAALGNSTSKISNIIFSKDINATCSVMNNFGADIRVENENIFVKGINGNKVKSNVMDCEESGSTLRFLIPLALIKGEEITFTGKGRLIERPLTPYYDIFNSQGIQYFTDRGLLPLTVKGMLKPGNFSVRGDISSQFISGLLFALPLLSSDSTINISTNLESKGYVDLTIDMLNRFCVKIENDDYKSFYIKGGQSYISTDYRVEGDYSQAAFWLAAGVLGNEIQCYNLNINSLQGDREIIDIIQNMGGFIKCDEDKIIALPSNLKGTDIDVSQCPDLVPILTVLAALSEGTTRIYNAARLRIKESDRLKAITTELKKIGADIDEMEDSLIIRGKSQLTGGTVDSWNDHRIVMALAIASIRCSDNLVITNSNAVDKSYPHFFHDFEALGGIVHEWNVG
jgi:3-phosphoshikimate 1-carboxyvinyltransferase